MSAKQIELLSNAALIAAFEVAYLARDGSDEAEHRVDLLHKEISRRDRMGLLTEDDWKEERQ
jgi:hypothetical protein